MHCASLRYQISPFLSMFLPERRIRKIHMTTTYTQRPGAAPRKRAAKKWAAFALAMGTAFAAAPVIPSAPASAATGTHDGSSSDKAAASCYEVKQVNPAASSGTYWLYTPQMSGPAQFYCDQETDGGGWVMVGRGRGLDRVLQRHGRSEPAASEPDRVGRFRYGPALRHHRECPAERH